MKFNDILLTEVDGKFVVSQQPEMKRVGDHWKKAGKSLSSDELREKIGHDLEMLEYNPEEVDAMIPWIVKYIRGGS